ncbi:hypothetical protein ACLBKT_09205 [Erythrobacter sp. W302b]|uniref:hypothetical protein n=1 Tax=Erythrobacter sp. W302b TaxID=3389874 RepID=UPI00396B4595
MRFFVDTGHVRLLLKEQFGGIENFVEEWAARQSGAGHSAQSRSIKTVYKWLAEGMPKHEESFFAFFGALDADPIALIDFERSGFARHFGRFRQAIMLAGLNVGGFRSLTHLMRPAQHWPDNQLTELYYGKEWSAHEFEHDAQSVINSYVTFRIGGTQEEQRAWPRAYHIAYRRKSNADGLWRPFGSIIARQSELILVHENGAVQTAKPKTSDTPIEFRTFFGPSAAEFRIACLHPFDASLDLIDDPDVPLVFAG